MSASEDGRDALYDDLHGGQLATQEAENYRSAMRILEILFRHYRPRSVLDVGCGLGTWLEAMQDSGVPDVMGVDGLWLKPERLRVDPGLVRTLDLEQPFDLGRRFDLVVSLEVAEHLAERAADGFVEALARHAPAVLFSAAIPFQGGHGHVNEQFLAYWIERFARFGLEPVDFVRGAVWNDPSVMWWLRQNTIFFARREIIEADDGLRAFAATRAPLSVVHPDLYVRAHEQSRGLQQLAGVLAGGGLFRATKDEAGRLTISKVE